MSDAREIASREAKQLTNKIWLCSLSLEHLTILKDDVASALLAAEARGREAVWARVSKEDIIVAKENFSDEENRQYDFEAGAEWLLSKLRGESE